MFRRIVACLPLTLFLLTVAHAQQPKKIPRVGYLGNTAPTSAISMKPFRERLRELGYIEGRNVTIESRYWEGKVERLPELAAELVRLNCDVIFTTGMNQPMLLETQPKRFPLSYPILEMLLEVDMSRALRAPVEISRG